ncbi:MAG: hypothetical protein M1823_000252 [Watsoniomyces obsoletus]|nr:MAG: hypothetical protein M1823_000252 [Watsoniomyces obsoletus]
MNGLQSSRWADEPFPPAEESKEDVKKSTAETKPSPGDVEPLETKPDRHATPTGTSRTPEINSMSASATPDTPSNHSRSLLRRLSSHAARKRLVWRGKTCIVALPYNDHRGDGVERPRLLSAEDHARRLQEWEDQGYDTRGFGFWRSSDGEGEEHLEGQGRAIWPDPVAVQQERERKDYKVVLPDRREWEAHVNQLNEEKLRSLGVSVGDDARTASASPSVVSTGRRTSSRPLLMALSPPPLTSSSTSNRTGQPAHPFSPPFHPSQSVMAGALGVSITPTTVLPAGMSALSLPGHLGYYGEQPAGPHRLEMEQLSPLQHDSWKPAIPSGPPQQSPRPSVTHPHQLTMSSTNLPSLEQPRGISIAQETLLGTQRNEISAFDELLERSGNSHQRTVSHLSWSNEVPRGVTDQSTNRPALIQRNTVPFIPLPQPSTSSANGDLERRLHNSEYHLEAEIERQMDEGDDHRIDATSPFDSENVLPDSKDVPGTSRSRPVTATAAPAPARLSELGQSASSPNLPLFSPQPRARAHLLSRETGEDDVPQLRGTRPVPSSDNLTNPDSVDDFRTPNASPSPSDVSALPRAEAASRSVPSHVGQIGSGSGSQTLTSAHSSEPATKTSLAGLRLNAEAEEFKLGSKPGFGWNVFTHQGLQSGWGAPPQKGHGLPRPKNTTSSNGARSKLNVQAADFKPRGLQNVPLPTVPFSFSWMRPSVMVGAPASSPLGHRSSGSASTNIWNTAVYSDVPRAGPPHERVFDWGQALPPAVAARSLPTAPLKAQPSNPSRTDDDGVEEDEAGRITQGQSRFKKLRRGADDGDNIPQFAVPPETKDQENRQPPMVVESELSPTGSRLTEKEDESQEEQTSLSPETVASPSGQQSEPDSQHDASAPVSDGSPQAEDPPAAESSSSDSSQNPASPSPAEVESTEQLGSSSDSKQPSASVSIEAIPESAIDEPSTLEDDETQEPAEESANREITSPKDSTPANDMAENATPIKMRPLSLVAKTSGQIPSRKKSSAADSTNTSNGSPASHHDVEYEDGQTPVEPSKRISVTRSKSTGGFDMLQAFRYTAPGARRSSTRPASSPSADILAAGRPGRSPSEKSARSSAPSSSPSQSQREINTRSRRPQVTPISVDPLTLGSTFPGGVRSARGPGPYRHGSSESVPASTWQRILSPIEDVKFQSPSQFLDGHVDRLFQRLLDHRLLPLEKSLSTIQDSITSIAQHQVGAAGSQQERRPLSVDKPSSNIQNSVTYKNRQNRSNSKVDSDADDEEDGSELAAGSSRSRSPRRDQKLEQIKSAIRQGFDTHATALQALHPVSEFSEIRQMLLELKTTPQEPRAPDLTPIQSKIEEMLAKSIPQESRPVDLAPLQSKIEEVLAKSIPPRVEATTPTNTVSAEEFKRLAAALDRLVVTAEQNAKVQIHMRTSGGDEVGELQKQLRLAEVEAARQRAMAEARGRQLRTLEASTQQEDVQKQTRLAAMDETWAGFQKTVSDLSEKVVLLNEQLREAGAEKQLHQVEVKKVNGEKGEMSKSIDTLKAQLEESIQKRNDLSVQCASRTEELTAAKILVEDEQAKSRRKDEQLRTVRMSMSEKLDAEVSANERLERKIATLQTEQKDAWKVHLKSEQLEDVNKKLETTVDELRREIFELQKENTKQQIAMEEAKKMEQTEQQRVKLLMEAEMELVRGQADIARAELESELARTKMDLEYHKLEYESATTRGQIQLEEAVQVKRDALRAAAEAEREALEKQQTMYEQRLKDVQADKEQTVQRLVDDHQRTETHLLDRVSLSDSKSAHLQERVELLEEKLEIARSAANAAAHAAQQAKVDSGSSSRGGSGSSHPEASSSQKVSPQALRESILVLQEQLQEREGRIEGLEQELQQMDREAPIRVKEQEMEIGWLRELLDLRVTDLGEIIRALSSTEFDRETIRDAAIRLKANVEMEQQERERVGSAGGGGSGGGRPMRLPSLSNSVSSAFGPPKGMLPLAAAWGSWRKGKSVSMSMSVGGGNGTGPSGGDIHGEDPTPAAKSSPGSARSLFSGLLTPPSTHKRMMMMSPTPRRESGQSERSLSKADTEGGIRKEQETSELQPGTPIREVTTPTLSEPATPTMLRRDQYDQDAQANDDFEEEMGMGRESDGMGSPMKRKGKGKKGVSEGEDEAGWNAEEEEEYVRKMKGGDGDRQGDRQFDMEMEGGLQ